MKVSAHITGNHVAPYSPFSPSGADIAGILSGRKRCTAFHTLKGRPVGPGRMNFSLSFFLLFLLSSFLPLAAQPSGPDTPPADTTFAPVAGDSLSLADSLALADTVQPELRVGLFGGLISTTAAVKELPLEPQRRTGMHAGVRAEMEFGYPIYFLVEFEYAQKGIRSSYTLPSGPVVEEDFLLDYLDVPIMYRVGIPVAERFSLSAGFGAHVSFLLSRNRILRIADLDSSSSIDRGLEKFDFGLEGRVGGELRFSPEWGLTADFRYLHGLQNILILEPNRTDNRSWKSRSLFFSAGVMYRLQRSIREL